MTTPTDNQNVLTVKCNLENLFYIVIVCGSDGILNAQMSNPCHFVLYKCLNC